MKSTTNMQSSGLTDVHNNPILSTRIRMVLASTGIAGTMLLGSLAGFHGIASAATVHTTKSNTAVVAQSRSTYVNMARQAAHAAGISPDLFVKQIQQESGFNPNAYSPAGAEGIAQFMPATAASMGVNPYNPSSALKGAARLMANLSAQYHGNYAKALAAYNAGGGAVNRAVAMGGGNWLAYMPTETRNYVRIIMG